MEFDASREGQLEEDRLKWGYWWVTHKVQVRRASIIALIVVDLLLVGYGAFGFVDWFLLSGVRERANIASMSQEYTDYASLRQKFAARDLAVEPAMVLGSGQDSFDTLARVTNPNAQWRVEFDYHFDVGGSSTATKHAYVLPGDSRWLHALGQKSEVRPSSAQLAIENVNWKRVDLHMTRPDYATWAGQRLDIRTSDVSYVGPQPQDPVAVSKAKFTVTNATGFGYFNVGFVVVLYSGSRITGVNRVAVSDLRAGEVKQVEASWFVDMPTASKVEVTPEINIFDPRAYITVGQ